MVKKIFNRIERCWRRTIFGRVKKNEKPIRWGVIGLGYMAETFSCAIDGNKNGIVWAVASRSLEKAKVFARRHGGCKAYGSYEEMVQDKSLNLDVVYIATPVKCHYENVKLCLNAGLNVLCEKPMTFSVKQFNELVDIAKRNGCFLMEGMWMKCLPPFRKACQWVNEGRIGKIQLVRADFYKREHIREGLSIYSAEAGGGVLHDFGVYAIAFVENFSGAIPRITNAVSNVSVHGIDSDWQITISGNDINAMVNLSSDFGSASKAVVIGDKGFIEWDAQFNRTNRIVRYNSFGEAEEVFSSKYEYEGFEYEVDEVQRCVVAGMKESPIVSLSATRNTLEIIEQLSETCHE